MVLLTREEFHNYYEAGEEACYQKVLQLLVQLSEQVESLTKRVNQLEQGKALNSSNSSKPPSTDQKKTRTLRKPSGKKTGGQKGHKGHSLEFSSSPDFIEIHPVHKCSHCSTSLESQSPSSLEIRQVFDLPEKIHLQVTEHQGEIKICSNCGKATKAEFPPEVDSSVQYGIRVKALATYLHDYQLIPYNRVAQFFEDVCSHPLSEGTLVNAEKECFHNLEETEKNIKQSLIDSQVAHFDESGMRIEGKRKWFHVASTENLTYYYSHEKRGKEGIDAGEILSKFEGTAIHDHWKAYFQYECEHGLCNAHHLRELFFQAEYHLQVWALEMMEFLLEVKKKVEEEKIRGAPSLSKKVLKEYKCQYEELLEKGLLTNPDSGEKEEGKRGKKAQSKGRNLVLRLRDYKNEVLRFMYDFEVPFSNNQGERDIRMIKVQQKISGGFRSTGGARRFCRIRGCISTAKKQGFRILEYLQNVFRGSTFIPCLS
jgi:transposase